jgi:UDP:flavonoid glycosyltransferase YjiC (YdhE family)
MISLSSMPRSIASRTRGGIACTARRSLARDLFGLRTRQLVAAPMADRNEAGPPETQVAPSDRAQGAGVGPMRLMVAAFGDTGHAFPAFALAEELHRRGHEVLVESWDQWREVMQRRGMNFTAAQEYTVYPPPSPDSPDGRTAAGAARALAAMVEEFDPDLIVSDILTLAPALAAEVAGIPRATLIPHVYPVQAPGMPFFSMGFRPPRTALGGLGWRATYPLLATGFRQGRRELNRLRAKVGLPPQERLHGGVSAGLAIVATLPHLEYPRRWPEGVRVTGPLFFELPSDGVELPGGKEPLVVVAPSTSQDPQCNLLRAALEGLADEPVRVVATSNRHRPVERIEVPDNAALEPWLPYSQVMPHADLVICHGGHGTVVRALSHGVPVLVWPALGDMAENGARVSWAGCGLTLPRRLLSGRRLALVTRRLLGEPRFRARAEEIAEWCRGHDGAAAAADAVEEYGGRASRSRDRSAAPPGESR